MLPLIPLSSKIKSKIKSKILTKPKTLLQWHNLKPVKKWQMNSAFALKPTGCFGTSWNWSSNGLNTTTINSGLSSSATYTFNSIGTYSVSVSALNFNGVPTTSNTLNIMINPPGSCALSANGNNEEIKPIGSKSRNLITDDVTIYPNPVNEALLLDQLEKFNSLRIVDQYGKILTIQPINGETQKSINVSQFTNGLYFIQFTNKTGEITTKKFQVVH
jgi:PKD repeat protein